jgi:hypothetical protein
MKPGVNHICVARGVEQTLTRYWKNGPLPGTTPIDTTGYSARFFVAKRGAATPVIDLSTTAGSIVLVPATGLVQAQFSRAAMQVPLGEYYYYLTLTSASGRDYPLLTGRFTVVEGDPL